MVACVGRLRAPGIELHALGYLSAFCYEDHVSLERLGSCVAYLT